MEDVQVINCNGRRWKRSVHSGLFLMGNVVLEIMFLMMDCFEIKVQMCLAILAIRVTNFFCFVFDALSQTLLFCLDILAVMSQNKAVRTFDHNNCIVAQKWQSDRW